LFPCRAFPRRSHTIEALLEGSAGGDAGTIDRLVPLIYDELRAVAHGQLRGEPTSA
jgi:hypothetical protein